MLPNRYAVIIGIQNYFDPKIPNLKYAKSDAQAIYDILTDWKVGGFPKENVKLLLDENATLYALKSALGVFLTRHVGKDTTVFIYFAGHGCSDVAPPSKSAEQLDKYIAPYDAEMANLYATALPMEELAMIFDRMEAERVIFIADTCYSGMVGGRTFQREGFRDVVIEIDDIFLERLSGYGRVVITACQANELAMELDELGHGILTYYVLEGLKGNADLDGDGQITLMELYRYIADNVPVKAKEAGGRQTPLLKGEIAGDFPLIGIEKTIKKSEPLGEIQINLQRRSDMITVLSSKARVVYYPELACFFPRHANLSAGLEPQCHVDYHIQRIKLFALFFDYIIISVDHLFIIPSEELKMVVFDCVRSKDIRCLLEAGIIVTSIWDFLPSLHEQIESLMDYRVRVGFRFPMTSFDVKMILASIRDIQVYTRDVRKQSAALEDKLHQDILSHEGKFQPFIDEIQSLFSQTHDIKGVPFSCEKWIHNLMSSTALPPGVQSSLWKIGCRAYFDQGVIFNSSTDYLILEVDRKFANNINGITKAAFCPEFLSAVLSMFGIPELFLQRILML
ncbi:TPA: hypothetical protein EYP66_18455, partial [Candidatus Poribacteria bacterium]|nr:hypothetical protein [Candidatus Poribacteria bacterium]